MTELEYVLSGFENRFSFLKDKRILLHGTREYAANIIDRFRKQFTFVGVMSFDTVEGHSFHGLPFYEAHMLADYYTTDEGILIETLSVWQCMFPGEAAVRGKKPICPPAKPLPSSALKKARASWTACWGISTK